MANIGPDQWKSIQIIVAARYLNCNLNFDLRFALNSHSLVGGGKQTVAIPLYLMLSLVI